MSDFQTFIAILTALLVFLTGVLLNYDTIELRNYQLIIPQWTGLLLAGITFGFVAVDQLLRGFIRLEEVQRQTEEEQRRDEERNRRDEERNRRDEEKEEEEQRRDEETRRRDEETRRREENSARATDERLTATERETRRTRIETRYRVAIIRFQLNPNNLYRRQLADILALLEEYQDTL